MVWLHGGGFRTGSGNSVFYEGKSLAQKHGVVVVTVTHRLNVFGFLHLAEIGGERFRQASNVGMQDLVLALEWVRDNIEAFGGDPGCVTIFGQSGGGGKTAILNGMPAAKGLFHRAIIQSTLWDTAITASEIPDASMAAEMFLARVGVKPGEIDKLQAMPTERLIEALTASGDISTRYVPVKDGRTVTLHPFEPTASALSASVPMMCGSNETESVPYANPDDPFWTSEIADEAMLRERVMRAIRIDDAAANRLIALYRSHRPADSRGDLALIIASDNSPLRLSAHAIAERKAAQGSAPVYTYLFKWRSPVDGGKLRSMHCMEIPFVFDHVDNCTFMNGRGADRYTLAEKHGRGVGVICADRKSQPLWPGGLACIRQHQTFDDGVRYRMPCRQRSVWRGTASACRRCAEASTEPRCERFTGRPARRTRRGRRRDRSRTRTVRTRVEWASRRR